MVPEIHYFDSLPSTNRKAFELAESGATHGVIVQAGSQTKGRGRLGKTWQSHGGQGLYFSIIVRPDLDLIDYPKITMTTGVAVADALEYLTPCKVSLKWPNDIFISEKKCCGILAESSVTNESNVFCIIGIGVNVLNSLENFSEDIRHRATSIYLETGRSFPLAEIRDKIWQSVLRKIQLLEKEGFSPIREEWMRRDFLEGKKLNWITNSGDIICGISEGTDENGELLVRDDKGEIRKVISGDITLAKQ